LQVTQMLDVFMRALRVQFCYAGNSNVNHGVAVLSLKLNSSLPSSKV
jgi:hypothetical protein